MGGGPSAPEASFRAASPDGLAALGGRLGESLSGALAQRSRLVLGLDGELGAGKTTLVAAALRALGVKTPVTSPTYGLVHPYRVHPDGSAEGFEVLHIDLYRLQHGSELEELGLPEDLAGFGAAAARVLFVEWFASAQGRLGVPDVSLFLGHADPGRIVRAWGNSPPGREIAQCLLEVRHRRLVPTGQ